VALRGKGFIVLPETQNLLEGYPVEYATLEEAQDEAARLYARSNRTARIIIFVPLAAVGPKIDKTTEFRLTGFAKTLLGKGGDDADIERQAEREVDQLLASAEPPPRNPNDKP
jgi:hypothetical protein